MRLFWVSCLGILFIVLIGGVLSASAVDLTSVSEKSVEDREVSRCRKLISRLKKPLIYLTLGFSFLVATPQLYHQTHALLHRTEHIGYGIHLNISEVEAMLNESELELIRDPEINWQKITKLFIEKLEGDYDKAQRLIFFPAPRLATTYLEGCAETHSHRGVCRHKSVVLMALLNHYGINARLQTKWEGEWDAHMWVYLPDRGYIADPTTGDFEPLITSDHAEDIKRSVGGKIVPYKDWKLTMFEWGFLR